VTEDPAATTKKHTIPDERSAPWRRRHDRPGKLDAAGGKTGLWRRILIGEQPPPLAAYRDRLKAPDAGRLGICCSGGGIRSAAYSLGALQVLQQRQELQRARYLSAVSGGSYIASAFTLAAKVDGTDDSVAGALGIGVDGDVRKQPFAPGSPEEQYLRNRTTYLAPTGVERIFFIYRALLGLAFNVLFIGLLLGLPAIGLGLGLNAVGYDGLLGPGGHTAAAPGWVATATICAVAASVGLAVLYLLAHFKWEWLRLAVQTWTVRVLFVALGLAFLGLLVPELVAFVRGLGGRATDPTAAQGGVAIGVPSVSLATILVGLAAQLRGAIKTPAQLIKTAGAGVKAIRRARAGLRTAVINVAGGVAVPLLVLSWFVLVVAWTCSHSTTGSVGNDVWIALGSGAGAFAIFYSLADLTSWSLHPFYRRRLASVFALRRTASGEAEERKVDELPSLSSLEQVNRPDVRPWPELLVCAAANVSDRAATPFGRPVTSYTFSQSELGGPLVGWVDTKEYEDYFPQARVDTMTAVAVSGAAVSPSMGKLTKAPFRALLAIANVRLGVWMPNPRELCSPRRMPRRPRPQYLIREVLGLNSIRDRYLYVTDGGHYENLGLVELLRRGCKQVYVFDASGGPTLESFGDAIAIARSELDVEIDIDVDPLAVDPATGQAKADCAAGLIRYPGDEVPGRIVYARQVLTPGAPYDVQAHALADPRFPHDSTADQFFTDQRFEAYRALGACAARHAHEAMTAPATGIDASGNGSARHWTVELAVKPGAP
jgi:hypothetical protein